MPRLSTGGGAGAYVVDERVRVEGNDDVEIIARAGGARFRGGTEVRGKEPILVRTGGSLTLTGPLVVEGIAAEGYAPTWCFLQKKAFLTVVDVVFRDNNGGNAGGVLALAKNSFARLNRVVFVNNNALGTGGGVHLKEGATLPGTAR